VEAVAAEVEPRGPLGERLTRPIPFTLAILLPLVALYSWGISWGTQLEWAHDEITTRQVLRSLVHGVGGKAGRRSIHRFISGSWRLRRERFSGSRNRGSSGSAPTPGDPPC
jgi:hypothetical protein